MWSPASASENQTRDAKKFGRVGYSDFFNKIDREPTSGSGPVVVSKCH